ncbi:hypothetical protein GQ55_8G239300 [Panicum hallii var. hallii]|uniref:Uncharacterized protein n=1 Tax=Panicum hallii var. hallii TaxID=1504633 RepID=A0A2T7CQL8_9POAL|nr:hypothetical protein GQ55_8G239300 [Panicum hallii var. hallii]
MVTIGGVLQPALKWEHYKLQSDDQGVTTTTRVWNEFWKRYRLPKVEEQCLQVRARSMFDKATTKVVRDTIYNARIQCVCLYYKEIKLQDMNKKLGAWMSIFKLILAVCLG